MIAVLILVGLVTAGILIGFVVTANAPMGYQDENGFHYNPETKREHDEAVGPAKLAPAVRSL